MKTATYYKDAEMRIPFKVKYDEQAPCICCGEPVHNASMGGTVLCPACDCGKCRFCRVNIVVLKESIDGGRSKKNLLNHMKWHREQLSLKEGYTEDELHKALMEFHKKHKSIPKRKVRT